MWERYNVCIYNTIYDILRIANGNATNPMSAIRLRVGHLSRNYCTARRNTPFYFWISLSWHCSTNDSSFRVNRTLFLRITKRRINTKSLYICICVCIYIYTHTYMYVRIYTYIFFFFGFARKQILRLLTHLDHRTRESIRVPSLLLYHRNSNCSDFPYRRTGSEGYQREKPFDFSWASNKRSPLAVSWST